MTEKPIYKSKKLVITVATAISAFIIAILPTVIELEPDSVQMLHDMLFPVLVLGGMILTGHSLQDAITAWNGLQASTIAPPQEVNIAPEATPTPEA